jgi:hypothetical protein
MTGNEKISRQPNGRLWEERNGKETLEVLIIKSNTNYLLGTSGCDREARKRATKEFQKQREREREGVNLQSEWCEGERLGFKIRIRLVNLTQSSLSFFFFSSFFLFFLIKKNW